MKIAIDIYTARGKDSTVKENSKKAMSDIWGNNWSKCKIRIVSHYRGIF